jgi:hypothetical protein
VPHSATRAILFSLAIALATAQPNPDQIAGRWRSTEVSPSGVSAVFEFHGGDRLDSYSAVITEQKYRVVGTDTILLQTEDGREEKQELEWDNQDRARIEDEAAGKSIELARAGKSPDAKNPLAGEWRTTREWSGRKYPALAVFSASGKVVWITEVRAEHGRYSVQNGNIRLEIPNRAVVEGSFAVAGDRLTLPNPKGGQSSFERFRQ